MLLFKRLLEGLEDLYAFTLIPPANRDLVPVSKGETQAVRFNFCCDNLIQIEDVAVEVKNIHVVLLIGGRPDAMLFSSGVAQFPKDRLCEWALKNLRVRIANEANGNGGLGLAIREGKNVVHSDADGGRTRVHDKYLCIGRIRHRHAAVVATA